MGWTSNSGLGRKGGRLEGCADGDLGFLPAGSGKGVPSDEGDRELKRKESMKVTRRARRRYLMVCTQPRGASSLRIVEAWEV
jgi:hypothetical protein